MSRSLSQLLLVFAAASCLFGIFLAIFRPAYLSDSHALGAIIFLQLLLAAIWNYRQRFFPLLLLIFLWAGVGIPLASIWTSGRWFVLAAGALAGLIIYMKDANHHFGMFHLVAFVSVLSALISAMVSSYPTTAMLKALSLLLLFLYGVAGARLAIVGRETSFFSGLLVACEIMVYITAAAYFALGFHFFGNPNSLGAVMGVALAPLLLWGILISEKTITRRRRSVAFVISLLLLFFSFARAGIVAGMVSCVLLCIALRRYRLLIKGAGVTALAAVLIYTVAPRQSGPSDSIMSTFVYKGQPESGVLSSRQSPWQQTVSVIREHPWFGSGFGTSPVGVDENLRAGKYASNSRIAREHGNSYLAILEWVGLFGVIPFLFLLLLIAVKIVRVLAWMHSTGDPLDAAVPIATVLVAGLVHTVFEDWLFAPGYYLCVFFWSYAFVLFDVTPVTVSAIRMPGVRPSSFRWSDKFGLASPFSPR
jgi:O-antigen ligase